jgi:signal transduction histidine kinase/ligand-binding sensor domain-containing protein
MALISSVIKYLLRSQVVKQHRLLLAINFLWLFTTAGVFGQVDHIRFEHITVENGLSQSWVHCIYQDKFDFIWIGTDDGLDLYDGNKMIVYKHNPRNLSTISSNSINIIFEDSKGNLWIGTSNGLNLFDRGKNHFNNFPEIFPTAVLTIAEEGNYLWVGTAEFLYKFSPTTKKIVRYGTSTVSDDSISNNYINKILIDSENNLWVGTNEGLNLYNRNDESFTKYFHDPDNPHSIGSDWVSDIIEDHQHRIWIGTRDGINFFKNAMEHSAQGFFIRYTHNQENESSISEGSVLALLEDNKRNLWISIENAGLDILELNDFDEKHAQFINYRHNPSNASSLNNNSIQTIFQDKQNIIWVGTFGDGINTYSQADATFLHFNNLHQGQNSISDNHVNTFLEDGEYIWIGTEGGLNRYSKSAGLFKLYEHDPLKINSIGSNAVWSIYKDSRENLWVGTWAGGLNLFDYEKESFSHFYFNPQDTTSLGSNNIFSILEDSQKNLWIGTMGGGLNKFDFDHKSFQRFNINNSEINSNYVEAIVEGSNSTLWLANVTSLEKFSTKTLTFEHFMQVAGDTNSLNGNKVFCIYKDSRKRLWVGTDAGLNLLDESTRRFTCYMTENGLPNNAIKSIIEDTRGNLWIGTNNGLSKFVNAIYPEKGIEFKNYTPKGGLQGYEFERRSCLKDKEGKLYFGGVNGFNIFNPDSIKDNTFIPKIVITDLLLFNKPVEVGKANSPLKQNIMLTKELTLTYKQNFFGFKFRALNYRYPENNQYAYKMEGFNDDWIHIGNQGEANFTNLDPGVYVFHVIGSNDDGIWNKEGASIKIIIRPPWWQSWWFRIFATITITMMLVSFYLWRVNELRQQKEMLEKKVISRTKEIEEKSLKLQQQTNELNETNILLEERQEYIEEQAEELKAQADELMEANKNLLTLNATKDKFFSIIAHDLKNPFTSILGFCEVLFSRYDAYNDEKRKHLIGIISQSAQNIYKLLENLLQWARSQTGTMKFAPEEFEIEELIANNLILMENQMNAKQIQSEKDIPPGLMVYADRNMINTVIRNLISNAIKFTEAGKITIRVKKDKYGITVFVSDTGVGMKSDEAKSLFEISASKSTEGTRGEPGTGLGLIICRDFIEKHGGEIGAESKEGRGSTFHFTIPDKN